MLDWGIADNATPPHVFVMNDDDKVLSLPDTEANRKLVERLAMGAVFVVRSDSERGFWSNDIGWVYGVEDATRFGPECLHMNLPMAQGKDAVWDVAEYADA